MSVSFAGVSFPLRDTFSVVRQCVPFTDSAYAAEVLADSPVAYWQMQDCGDFPQDSSGNGRHMTDYLASPSMAYRRPGALVASAPLDRSVFLPFLSNPRRTGTVTTAVDNVTMEMWVNLSSVEAAGGSLGHVGASGSNGWGIFVDSARKLNGLLGGVGFIGTSSAALSLNTWYHVALRRQSGTWTHFIDGAVDTTGLTGTPNTPSAQFFIEISGEFFASHVAVYATALSDARIAAHYAAA